jgi:hypothetical protein
MSKLKKQAEVLGFELVEIQQAACSLLGRAALLRRHNPQQVAGASASTP